MSDRIQSIDRSYGYGVDTQTRNKVLRNTYWLLALSLVPTVLGAWLGRSHWHHAITWRRLGTGIVSGRRIWFHFCHRERPKTLPRVCPCCWASHFSWA
jgi:FtsH-binding integral membrane protein